jgi:hypothetical protein
VAPLEPWEKVLVSLDFTESQHGKAACTDCHGGQNAADKATAHTDMVADPSAKPADLCGKCHPKETATYATSLHATQAGYWAVLNKRSTPANHAALETMFGNHCSSCHTTCGDCHISRPGSAGSGFLSGHQFEKTPPMTTTCTACHGSRVGNEFLGKNLVAADSEETYPGDVHFREVRMLCTNCHTGTSLHDSGDADHRYAGAQSPTCESCHPKVGAGGDGNQQHTLHKDKLSCQVCHSITYTNCDSCHTAISKETGNPYYKTDGTYMGFLIGRNPNQTADRPYEYVPVRHIPVAADQFEFYGKDLLPNFDALPTWAYATPHNIQRNTPQTETCNACHGNAKLFLTADKVKAAELAANKPVIVEKVPAGH